MKVPISMIGDTREQRVGERERRQPVCKENSNRGLLKPLLRVTLNHHGDALPTCSARSNQCKLPVFVVQPASSVRQ